MQNVRSLLEKIKKLEREKVHLLAEIEKLKRAGEEKASVLEEDVTTLQDEVESLKELLGDLPSLRKYISEVDYMDVKIRNAWHSKTRAYTIFLAGIVFFVGGLLETIITIEDPDWFLFIPHKLTPDTYSQNMYARLGLFMVLIGFELLVLGTILGIKYWRDERQSMNQLNEIYRVKQKQ